MDYTKDQSKEKQDIIYNFEKRFRIQEQTLQIIFTSVLDIITNNKKDIRFIWNLAGYINLVAYDLKVICRDLLIAENKWQEQHYARQASLAIYEAINDLLELLGTNYKKGLQLLSIPDSSSEIKSIRNELNQFKKQYFLKLKNIRNMTIGHREKNSLNQMLTIIQIEKNEIVNIIFEFEKIMRKIEKYNLSNQKELSNKTTSSN